MAQDNGNKCLTDGGLHCSISFHKKKIISVNDFQDITVKSIWNSYLNKIQDTVHLWHWCPWAKRGSQNGRKRPTR